MKKAIVIMLTGAMMLAAVACGGGSNSTPAQETKTEEAKPAEETQETVESTVVEPERSGNRYRGYRRGRDPGQTELLFER